MYLGQQTHANECHGAIGAPREMSGLEHAISSNHRAADELAAALEQLEHRISTVLQPEPPLAAGEAGKGLNLVNPVQSFAVDQLQALRQRLESLANRVNGIASRFD